MSDILQTWLIVGLGNPGPKYQRTRHNLGFLVIDALAQKLKAPPFQKKFQGQWLQTQLGISKVHLLKPETFMNLSGQSILEAAQFFKIPTETHLVVVVDDLDLPPGQLRLRSSGGSGGHNGLNSTIECLGNEQFARLRFGIGKHPHIPAEHYVLSKITDEEWPIYSKSVQLATDGLISIVENGLEKSLNLINQKRES